jgi:regulatory protein
MRPPPRQISGEGELYTVALRALMRRAYSVFEMRVYLERRAGEPVMARRIVTRLKQEKLIDDARYALDFARYRANSRRQGRYRIVRELRTRGIPDRLIESAVAQIFSETDEALAARKLIERRMRSTRAPLDERRVASLYRMLLRAGFESEIIRRELHNARRAQAADATPDLEKYSPDEG